MEKISRKSFVKGALGLGLTRRSGWLCFQCQQHGSFRFQHGCTCRKEGVYVCRHCPLGCPV